MKVSPAAPPDERADESPNRADSAGPTGRPRERVGEHALAGDALALVLGQAVVTDDEASDIDLLGDTRYAMSQENVEVVRRAYELWREGGLDAIEAYLDPEIEWETRWPGLPPMFHGRDGVKEWAARVVEPMQVDMQLIEAREIDQQRVLAALRLRGQGRESGVPTEMNVFDIYSLRNGMIFHRQTFYSEAEALAAVGLEE